MDNEKKEEKEIKAPEDKNLVTIEELEASRKVTADLMEENRKQVDELIGILSNR